jgi:hypothetical protein
LRRSTFCGRKSLAGWWGGGEDEISEEEFEAWSTRMTKGEEREKYPREASGGTPQKELSVEMKDLEKELA